MTSTHVCTKCGATVAGRFCAECGTPVAELSCVTCATPLTAGAKFCHRCGTPAGGGTTARPASRGAVLPWSIAAISTIGFITVAATANWNENAAAAAAEGPPAGMVAPFANGGGGGGGTPPDISQMSPEERADRLYNRIMSYAERGKTDSAAFFAPMAMMAYQALGTLSADQRFHIGTIGLATGDPEGATLAKAQADTILKAEPKHLLGLILGAQAAERTKDQAAQKAFEKRFLAAMTAELATSREEYQLHKNTIDAVAQSAKSGK